MGLKLETPNKKVSRWIPSYGPISFYKYRFMSSPGKVIKTKNKLHIGLVLDEVYHRSELNKLGIKRGSDAKLMQFLPEKADVHPSY